MTVTAISSAAASMQIDTEAEELLSIGSPSTRSALHKHGHKELYRTNTFPRRTKVTYSQRSVTQPISVSPSFLSPLPTENGRSYSVVRATPTGSNNNSGSRRGLRRGLSEHVQRLGRGTLDKIQRINRARKVAGEFGDSLLFLYSSSAMLVF